MSPPLHDDAPWFFFLKRGSLLSVHQLIFVVRPRPSNTCCIWTFFFFREALAFLLEGTKITKLGRPNGRNCNNLAALQYSTLGSKEGPIFVSERGDDLQTHLPSSPPNCLGLLLFFLAPPLSHSAILFHALNCFSSSCTHVLHQTWVSIS